MPPRERISTKTPGRQSYVLGPATGPDTLTVQGPFTYKGSGFTLTCVFSLPPGSLTSAALKHPMKFSPSPANVTSPKSYMSYTLNGTTKLGLAGTVSSK